MTVSVGGCLQREDEEWIPEFLYLTFMLYSPGRNIDVRRTNCGRKSGLTSNLTCFTAARNIFIKCWNGGRIYAFLPPSFPPTWNNMIMSFFLRPHHLISLKWLTLSESDIVSK